MSSEPRLGPVSYLVLGVIALREPRTPYELKRFVQLSIGHFWPFPHTQLYAEPARLAEAGLLEETREEGGRRRRHYSITESGRRRLTEWLAESETSPTEFRDFGLLKLFFSELAAPEDMSALAHEQASAHRRKLAEYDVIAERFDNRPDLAKRLVSLELGIRLSRTAAEFWDEVAAREAGGATEAA
jgi:PadR family transcriptional regulator AphA